MLRQRWISRLCFCKNELKILKTIRQISSSRVNFITQNEIEIDRDISLERKLKEHSEKILFTTVVHGTDYSFTESKIKEALEKKMKRYELFRKKLENPVLACLRYLPEYEGDGDAEESSVQEEARPFNLPFGARPKHFIKKDYDKAEKIKNYQWLTDYENFDDAILTERLNTKQNVKNVQNEDEEKEEVEKEDYDLWKMDFGVPDPMESPSCVPCGGCGAHLHCIDTAIPGYVPSIIFKNCSSDDLKSIVCQRCHFLKNYNVALNVSVAPEEYPKILSNMRHRRALILLLVDLLDFPNSIWPGIIDIIGPKPPVIIIGNKLDLLPPGEKNCLSHIKQCLRNAVLSTSVEKANIKDVMLVSAKTHFGIEDLITKLFDTWRYNGDVFIIGCTNVGKSTLFNILLQSDYCKAGTTDLLQRATVSPWPGTTLNLLKFPILRPNDWKINIRAARLKKDGTFKPSQIYKIQPYEKITLIGYVGKTFYGKNEEAEKDSDLFSYSVDKNSLKRKQQIGIDEKSLQYRFSRWCYDTPGVVHHAQILSILTLEELMLTLPKSIIKPRVFNMTNGTTLFLAGLGRVDFECEEPGRLTVFASQNLPVTICHTKHAGEIYSEFLGTEVLGVPIGDEERLSRWPKLECGEKFTITGKGERVCCADITLSSAGWVSITGPKEQVYHVTPWTPEKRGIHLREPALMPNGVLLRGKRIMRTPAYNMIKTVTDIQMSTKPTKV